MGKMKEPLTDHVQCRVEKITRRNHFVAGSFFLTRFAGGTVFLRHISGEGFETFLSTFEKEVCPWDDLAGREGVEELVREFYKNHF